MPLCRLLARMRCQLYPIMASLRRSRSSRAGVGLGLGAVLGDTAGTHPTLVRFQAVGTKFALGMGARLATGAAPGVTAAIRRSTVGFRAAASGRLRGQGTSLNRDELISQILERSCQSLLRRNGEYEGQGSAADPERRYLARSACSSRCASAFRAARAMAMRSAAVMAVEDKGSKAVPRGQNAGGLIQAVRSRANSLFLFTATPTMRLPRVD